MYKLANRAGKILPDCTIFKAFSLVEMLMALLVASLLMAALAPVMTRRMHENVVVSGTGKTILPKVYCAYINNGLIPVKKETIEEGCAVPNDTYYANIIMASGGGGGGGAVESANGVTDYTLMPAYTGGSGAATTGGGSTQSVKFSKSSHTMWIYLAGGGSGGGGGNGEVGIVPNEENCKALGSIGTYTDGHSDWVTYDGFGLCVTKFNQISGISNCAPEQSSSTCTSSHAQQLYSYSGCNRKACTLIGARQACSNLSTKTGDNWKLPSGSEGTKWANNLPLWRKIGMCDRDTAGVLVRCGCGKNTASSHGSCSHEFWSNDANDVNPTLRFSFNTTVYSSGLLFTAPNNDYANIGDRAHSTRCVLSETYNRYTGGGGASGAFVKLKVPSAVLKRAAENGEATLVTFAGNGGRGGNSKSATRGVAGTHSYAEILDSNNDVIWRATVPGASSGGEGGKTASGGAGGVVSLSNSCKYFDITNPEYLTEKTVNCTDLPDAVFNSGENGGAGSFGTDYGTTGYGARSAWGDGSLQGLRIFPPSGASVSLVDGNDATIAGGGGSGGNCYYKDGNLTCGKGGNGAGGRIYATHRISFPGAGGGGGAAGTVAHIKNIQVRPGDFFKIQAGHGGNGGNIGAKGTDGGNSYVELTRGETGISRYEISGGGGGNPAVKGNPDTNTQPAAGTAGEGSKIINSAHIPNDEYFPKKQDETRGSDGSAGSDYISAYGGNGGINSKISPLAPTDGTMNGKPCGGLNTGKIKVNDETEWECSSGSIIPLNLTRTLNDMTITASAIGEIIKDLAPGSTGGGGGGWQNGAVPEASGGAKGMGGYVIIYFGDWSTEEGG